MQRTKAKAVLREQYLNKKRTSADLQGQRKEVYILNPYKHKWVTQFDYTHLKNLIREKYGGVAFAQKMGMSLDTLTAKLNGGSKWTHEEVCKARELLEIAPMDDSLYFFNRKSFDEKTKTWIRKAIVLHNYIARTTKGQYQIPMNLVEMIMEFEDLTEKDTILDVALADKASAWDNAWYSLKAGFGFGFKAAIIELASETPFAVKMYQQCLRKKTRPTADTIPAP